MQENLGITVRAKDEASQKLGDVQKSVEGVGKSGASIAQKLEVAGVAIAGIGAGLTAYSKKATDATVEYAKSTSKLARETGLSIEQASRLSFVMQRFGLDASSASVTFGFLSKQIVANNNATGDAALKQQELAVKMQQTRDKIRDLTAEKAKYGDKTGEISLKIQKLNIDLQQMGNAMSETGAPLKALNIATQNADGSTRNFNDILLDVADKFRTMPNGAEKTALAMQLFGRSGKELIPILNQGREGIQKLGEEADKLGITLTPQNFQKVQQYIQAQKALKASTQALTVTVGLEAVPMWQKLTQATNSGVQALLTAPTPIKQITTAIAAFGGPVLTAGGTLLTLGANMSQVTGTHGKALLAQIPLIGGAIEGLGGAFGALGSFLMGPWGIALAAVVIGITVLAHELGGFQALLQGVMPYLQEIWQAVVILLQPAINNLKIAWAQLSEAIRPFMPALEEMFKFIGIVAIGVIGGLIVTLALLVVAVANVIGWIARLVGWLAHDLVDAFRHPGEAAENLVRTILRALLGPIPLMFDAGFALIQAFANGIAKAFNIPIDKVKEILHNIRRLLPFSDAKEGPLSDLTLSGQRLGETFARGIAGGADAVQQAARGLLTDLNGQGIGVSVNASQTGSTQATGPASVVSSGGGGDNFHVHVGTFIGTEAEKRSLAVELAQLVEQAKRGQGTDNINMVIP